jgi:AraC family transcriptional regulator
MEHWNEALSQIEDNLDGEIDVAALARVAQTSEYHFRRMFSTLSGLPLSEYVRRRRLTQATAEILDGDAGVLEVAVEYSYGSADAFTRAFKAMHGLTPSEARRPGGPARCCGRNRG